MGLDSAKQPNVLRIFVSSTIRDLKDERLTLAQAVLRRGHFPVMKSFTTRPTTPVPECLRLVESSQAMVVIASAVYGWVPSTDEGGDGCRSITWLEVSTALKVGLPVLAFLLDTQESVAERERRPVARKKHLTRDFRHYLRDNADCQNYHARSNLSLGIEAHLPPWLELASEAYK
jgi:hypothetical protein